MFKATIIYQDAAGLKAEESFQAPGVECRDGPQGTIAIESDPKTVILPAARVVSIIIVKDTD